MKYKLVAVDIDGTLLNSKSQLSDKNIEAIKRSVEKGIILVLSSGRPVQGVKLVYDSLGLEMPCITYNGAMIIEGRSMEILFEKSLEDDDARQIMDLGYQYNTTMMVWSNNKLYVNKMNQRVNEYKKISQVEPILIDDREILFHKGITKILWFDDEVKIDQYLKDINPNLKDSVTACTSRPIFLEFFHSKASKGLAMEKLGEHYHISKEEMIAIGDGLNDLSMLQYAGLGVVMENAPSAVKEVADYITYSNDRDGVAYVLDHFIE